MELEGLSEAAARERISLFDLDGLIEPLRTRLTPDQQRYVHPHAPTKKILEAIASIKPTILIGVSTVGGAFAKDVVEAMTKLNQSCEDCHKVFKPDVDIDGKKKK